MALEGARRAPDAYLRAAEAAGYTMLARIAIRVLPFRHLTWLLTRPLRRPTSANADQTRAIADVRRAVLAAARLPGDASCLTRAVVAQAMLRRRGVHSTVYYGASTAGAEPLRAHAWVRAGDEAVVGHETAGDYVVVATYSPAG